MTNPLTSFPVAHEPSMSGNQDDFNWEFGTWRSTVRVLTDPLSDTPNRWTSFTGTSVVRALADGRANVVELRVSGPSGRIDALNLRLYEPHAQRWSMTFVSLRDGTLTPSVLGAMPGRAGAFYGDDHLAGRSIKVRFLVHRIGPSRARFEQAFSADDGATWETNWIALDTRTGDGA